MGGVPVALMVVACDDIELIEIIRNSEVIYREKGNGVFTRFQIEDTNPPKGTNWYYGRIVQKDGNMAWSSPVWVDCID